MTEVEALVIGLVLITYGYVALYWSADLFVESGRPFECDFSQALPPITNSGVRFGAWAMLLIGLALLVAGVMVARHAPG